MKCLLTVLFCLVAFVSSRPSDNELDEFDDLSVGEYRNDNQPTTWRDRLKKLNIRFEAKTKDGFHDLCLKFDAFGIKNHKVCAGVRILERAEESTKVGFRLRYKECSFFMGKTRLRFKLSRCVSKVGHKICFKDLSWKNVKNEETGQDEIKVNAVLLYNAAGRANYKLNFHAKFVEKKLKHHKFDITDFNDDDLKFIEKESSYKF